MNAATEMATAQMIVALPDLSHDGALAALTAAVPIPGRGVVRIVEELGAHLAAHPDALTSGDSRCPRVLLRLVRVLGETGYPVTRPGCAQCGTIRDDLSDFRSEGRVCGVCAARSRPRKSCARCGRTDTRIAARRAEGVICHACYRTDPQIFEECAQCGQQRRPAVRLDSGRALCDRCHKYPLHQCVSCGETKTAAAVDENGAFCHSCYNRQRRPQRQCGRCGRIARIARNATDDHPDLCLSCYRGPEATCSRCGRTGSCQRAYTGEPICRSCYARHERPRVTCCGCGRDRQAMANWPIGPVCAACYNRIVRSPADCARCSKSQPLIARDENDAGVCGRCAGADIDYTCHRCGRGGNPYGNNICAYCVLADRVEELLTGDGGRVTSQLQPLVDAFTRVPDPYRAIRWISRSPNAKLLATLIRDGRNIDHELLDELLPHGRGVHYIRQVLVETGVLPRRHEDLERLPSWFEHLMADKPDFHTNLLRPYLHWHLLRRARRRAAARRYPASAGRLLRRRILIATEFLAWIDDHGLTLQELGQADLERWLDSVKSQRCNQIRYFLKWTAARGITQELTVVVLPRQHPEDLLDDDARWKLLRQCLTDDTMPLDVRTSGALVLLLGLQVERIRSLCTEHVVLRHDNTFLDTGSGHPGVLPPKVGRLLQEQLAATRPRLMIQSGTDSPRWLFPGLVPGQPVFAHALTTRLNRYGISTRPARNGALMALAADLPAPIMADLLGMHINTAVRWVQFARRDWTDYLAARGADLV
jgi:hypothetical protein